VSQPFPDEIVRQAFIRANGRCECERSSCNHQGQCNKSLIFSDRGRETPSGWEAHHRWAGGPPTLSNCEILCTSCHKNTRSYGR